jgi:rhamnosyltransferase subunit B
MNILLVTLGSYGDVFPMAGIGAKLAQRGHSVTLFTNEHYRPLARQHGLGFVPVGSEAEFRRFADHPDLFDPRKAFSAFMDTVVLPNIRPAYEQLQAHVRPGETVIAATLNALAARLVQEKSQVPMATVHLTPLAIKSAYTMPKVAGPRLPDWAPPFLRRFYWWVADKAVIDPIIAPQLNAFRQDIGLAPVERILTRWVHSPHMVICLFPDWYAAPKPDWPPNTHLTGFPLFDEGDGDELPAEAAAFLGAGPAPIVFMPGSLMQQASDLFDQSVQACQALGRRAILLSRFAQQVPQPLPEGVRHFAYLPFGKLLPHCAALVHHGGIGTMAQALRAGVPQLIHPMAYDQHDNAARVQALGVGDAIVPADYRAAVVADRLRRLTESPDVLARCCAVAARFEGTDPLLEACRLIESML